MSKRPELRINDIDPKLKIWIEKLAKENRRSVPRQAEFMLLEYKKLKG